MNHIVLLGLAAVAAIGCDGVKENMVSAKVPPARDGNIAIQEEYCAARARATRAAYDLFIARHPAHPLADAARAERARIGAQGKAGGADSAPGGAKDGGAAVRCAPPSAD